MLKLRALAAALLLPACSSPVAQPNPSGPVNSDLALSTNGGGCYPTGMETHELGQILLVNPEWAPIKDGKVVSSEPVLVHGTVKWSHGDTGGDFPATHLRSDHNAAIRLDDADAWRLATGNGTHDPTLELEWESGSIPAWAWSGAGDRIVALGRWIFDCGHPNMRPRSCIGNPLQVCDVDTDCAAPACPSCPANDRCDRQHFAYESELHPPQATAVIRQGRGAIVSTDPGAQAVPATRVDVYVSADGGAAGDRCILEHVELSSDLLLNRNCFPLSQPVAQLNLVDFPFDVPLPPRPSKDAKAEWRFEAHDRAGDNPADVEVNAKEDGDSPHLQVRVKMRESTKQGGLPSGYAATLFAGWKAAPSPLTHVRLTVSGVTIKNALQPVSKVVREVKRWRLQAQVNGQYQELAGLESVSTGDVIQENLVFEQWLPPDGSLHLVADGTSSACIDTLFGQAIMTGANQLGLMDEIKCILTSAASPGDLDETYPGPDFGAGDTGSKAYETPSDDGDGGKCAMSGKACLGNDDCAGGEACQHDGSAFLLRYTIERLP